MKNLLVPCIVAALSLTSAASLAQTVSDSFDDNSRDGSLWRDPEVFVGNGSLLEQNGRLEWVASNSSENEVGQGLLTYPNYNSPWQLEMVVAVETSNFSSPGQTGSIAITVGSSLLNDDYLEFGLGAGVLPGISDNQALFTSAYDGSKLYEPTPSFGQFPIAIGLRLTYDPTTRLIRMYYDQDTDSTDGEWTLFQAYTIDGSTRDGAETMNLGMSANDFFWFEIIAHSESSAMPAGSAWLDNFSLHVGTTALSEPGSTFQDDFDDDNLHPNWGLEVRSGTPELIEESNRLQFRTSSTLGEQEIAAFPDSTITPRFDQAFEARVEMHWLPDNMSVGGQVSGGDLILENLAGFGEFTLSVGAIFESGQLQQVRAIDDSEIASEDDMPEVLVFGPLPQVVGARIVWSPNTATLSCYFDTDGDRTTETWELAASYSLDGVDRGATHISDWQMAPEDRFRIGVKGYAFLTAIGPGEAYFENFTLTAEPLVEGYQAWAASISDQAMQDPTADASGNGIPNLLQYLYGLPPLATDTDVQLRIAIEGGNPVLVHGLNESASDYVINYQMKSALNEPWTPLSTLDALSIETIESGGKTFRRVVFPTNPSNTFIQLNVEPAP
ncbi:MAG: hypothetical protein RI897_242 [Verrucomicrobiota bacterium]|jgi:hypothetical protein